MFALLRFQPHVTANSQIYGSLQKAVDAFNTQSGISAALTHVGHGEMNKQDVLQELDWPDRSNNITHCLTISADSTACLKQLQGNPIYSNFLGLEQPHLVNDGWPAAVIFFNAPSFATT